MLTVKSQLFLLFLPPVSSRTGRFLPLAPFLGGFNLLPALALQESGSVVPDHIPQTECTPRLGQRAHQQQLSIMHRAAKLLNELIIPNAACGSNGSGLRQTYRKSSLFNRLVAFTFAAQHGFYRSSSKWNRSVILPQQAGRGPRALCDGCKLPHEGSDLRQHRCRKQRRCRLPASAA